LGSKQLAINVESFLP